MCTSAFYLSNRAIEFNRKGQGGKFSFILWRGWDSWGTLVETGPYTSPSGNGKWSRNVTLTEANTRVVSLIPLTTCCTLTCGGTDTGMKKTNFKTLPFAPGSKAEVGYAEPGATRCYHFPDDVYFIDVRSQKLYQRVIVRKTHPPVPGTVEESGNLGPRYSNLYQEIVATPKGRGNYVRWTFQITGAWWEQCANKGTSPPRKKNILVGPMKVTISVARAMQCALHPKDAPFTTSDHLNGDTWNNWINNINNCMKEENTRRAGLVKAEKQA